MIRDWKKRVFPFYYIAELADMMGLDRDAARRRLSKSGIPMHLQGGKYVIYLTDIQTHAPVMMQSIEEAQTLNELKEPRLEDDEQLPEYIHKKQFER